MHEQSAGDVKYNCRKFISDILQAESSSLFECDIFRSVVENAPAVGRQRERGKAYEGVGVSVALFGVLSLIHSDQLLVAGLVQLTN